MPPGVPRIIPQELELFSGKQIVQEGGGRGGG